MGKNPKIYHLVRRDGVDPHTTTFPEETGHALLTVNPCLVRRWLKEKSTVQRKC